MIIRCKAGVKAQNVCDHPISLVRTARNVKRVESAATTVKENVDAKSQCQQHHHEL